MQAQVWIHKLKRLGQHVIDLKAMDGWKDKTEDLSLSIFGSKVKVQPCED